ncbi:MAG: PHP domain-containing protein [Acidaminococcaceae bacterium]
MQEWIGDFHIHTLLSPCAEIEMTPHHIVLRAAEAGVQMLAITDHNTSANVEAALVAAEEYGVKVFPGMEVECKEEAHLVLLFDRLEQVQAMQSVVDAAMSGRKNVPERFGSQFVVDADDEFVAEEERLLLAPLTLSAAAIISSCSALGGLSIAAHIDRPAYSLVGQLGFLPPDLDLAAAEISPPGLAELQLQRLRRLVGTLPYITNSDAHRMADFLAGPKNLVRLATAPTVAELKLALAGAEGRSWQAGYRLTLNTQQ